MAPAGSFAASILDNLLYCSSICIEVTGSCQIAIMLQSWLKICNLNSLGLSACLALDYCFSRAGSPRPAAVLPVLATHRHGCRPGHRWFKWWTCCTGAQASDKEMFC